MLVPDLQCLRTLRGCSVTKFVTELPELLKHVGRSPTSWFFCRRRFAPTFSPAVPRCLPHSAQLTIFQRRMDRTLLRINQSALLTPSAVLKHQAKQITNARSRAAEGSLASYTISLLANTQVRSSKNRVAWTLKFTLPTLAKEGTTRCFSAVPKGYGPSGAQALEEGVRYAHPFDCQHEATTLLSNSDFRLCPGSNSRIAHPRFH